ncbi:MAG: hypothetical protein QRY16_14275 [Enterobacterales bacterium endosymbiont of Blomia tropicalis]|uniref:hypothetical protein n=1 Tax=Mixta mediterraneensis TaxID=2758443 RepID=UPI0025A9302C|nr:hypothetical protein [Mixta mediterraneensis]MDL4914907.1 hypothetical protein [Mixta mediterraneensis]
MLKLIVITASLTSIFLSSSAFASRLPTPVYRYDAEDDSVALHHKTAKDIIPRITLDGRTYRFEENTLVDIQRALGGEIHHTQRTEWICFYNRADQQTLWFLSNKVMQHGRLSGVAISQNGSSADCTKTDKPLSVSYSVPGPGAQHQTLSRYFDTPPGAGSPDSFYCEHALDKGATQLNGLQYYFTGDKVSEILFSQVTTM